MLAQAHFNVSLRPCACVCGVFAQAPHFLCILSPSQPSPQGLKVAFQGPHPTGRAIRLLIQKANRPPAGQPSYRGTARTDRFCGHSAVHLPVAAFINECQQQADLCPSWTSADRSSASWQCDIFLQGTARPRRQQMPISDGICPVVSPVRVLPVPYSTMASALKSRPLPPYDLCR